MKIVLNCCHGGFGLSDEAFELLIEEKEWPVFIYDYNEKEKSGELLKELMDEERLIIKWINGRRSSMLSKYSFNDRNQENLRKDKDLIEIVERLKEKANGQYAKLGIAIIPDNIDWYIDEHSGSEWIAENHRTWYADICE